MPDPIETLLAEAKRLAVEYFALTGRPLGITGEVAEYEAARLLDLRLMEARSAGYDAIEDTESGEKRIQIKGRRRDGALKPWGRLGKIDLKKEFDSVMLVLLDANYRTVEIWEAPRASVEAHLTAPGSKSRNERGQMACSAFVGLATATKRWPT